ncbi:MAG: 30S ribosomal protein S3 [Patescibacteria group bacterium]|nr:30S ribosomal protein S3 [Patescibacteria group bacterium]
MGHKINPTSFRLKITDTWKSKWFSKNHYRKLLQEDVRIREYLEKHLKKSGLVRIDIERKGDGSIVIIIKTTKPGLIIGKGGAGIEELRKKVKQKLGIKTELKVNIEEVRDINLQAQTVANGIAEQLEKRVAFRKLMKQSLEQIMQAGAKGAKVAIGGRLNGADIARTEHLASGKIPLHTLRADIDFARSTAFTTYGTVGVKVWIYRGDVFEEKKVEARNPKSEKMQNLN